MKGMSGRRSHNGEPESNEGEEGERGGCNYGKNEENAKNVIDARRAETGP
jgi:hypothetical protein